MLRTWLQAEILASNGCLCRLPEIGRACAVSKADVGDAMHVTAAERAIIDLEQKVGATLNAAERDRLLRLLIKAIDDLARGVEFSSIVQRRLADIDACVKQQKELVARLKRDGNETNDAYFHLVSLKTMQALLTHRLALTPRQTQHGGSWAGITVPTENLKPLGAMRPSSERTRAHPSKAAAFGSGAIIGTLAGLIGLGGAEFRLPLLIKTFRFEGLEAIIL